MKLKKEETYLLMMLLDERMMDTEKLKNESIFKDAYWEVEYKMAKELKERIEKDYLKK